LRGILQRAWVRFISVFAISLPIVLFVFQARVDFLSLTTGYVTLNIALAILTAMGSAIVLALIPSLLWRSLTKFIRRSLATIALTVFRKALTHSQGQVPCQGIGQRDGSVVMRLESGGDDGVFQGLRLLVSNAADRQGLGIIEAVEIDGRSCICSVFNMSNPHFWEELEGRMDRDASPPQGVTIRREFPEEIMDMIRELLAAWRR